MDSSPSAASEWLLRPSPPEACGDAAIERRFTVLLIDDNHHHRMPLLRALRERGYEVLHAADGVSGDALSRASKIEIDSLVVCSDMKRMSGVELARRVACMRPELRVLLMWSQFTGPDEIRRAYEHGYAGIEEPFTPEQLCRRLTLLLASPIAIGSNEQH